MGSTEPDTRSPDAVTQDTLRESESLFRALAELVPCCVWAAGPDGAITYANRRWHQFTGLSPEGTAGFEWASALHPEDREHCLAAWRHSVESGNQYRIEARYRRYDGEYRWFLSEGTAVRDREGRITAWFGTSTDIQDQKQTQEALQDADRRKNEFLAMLGHEIRNPLAVISNASRVLNKVHSPPPEVLRLGQMIERQVGHLTRIVDDLLDVSRVLEGKVRLRREPAELATIVSNAAESAGPYLEIRKQVLRVSLPKEPIWIEADVTRMTQVLANLLNNAAKFSEKRGEIAITGFREGNDAVLAVADTGSGISADMLPYVFDMFVQEDRSLHRARGGLGIGLTLARSLVSIHRGTIAAKSAGVGHGAEFIVRIPAIDAPSMAQPAQAKAGTAGEAGTLRILVVDDSADSAESMGMILSMGGHEVRTALDSGEAQRIAIEFRPDVALLDIGLPGTDGYEVGRRLRSEPTLQGIYLVAVTGYGQDEDRKRSEEAGFHAHLVKPVDPAMLRVVMAAARNRVGVPE
jgi:PAS domain S-box-containing protein